MTFIRLDLAYDGTPFMGWQAQGKTRTVQQVLEDALEKIHHTRPKLSVAGRTDTGVHARHQCCAYQVPHSPDPLSLQKALRTLLPPTIDVWRVSFTDETFHPRRSALARSYEYWVDTRPRAEPWKSPYVWSYYRYSLNLENLRAMANMILGESNFSSFCSARDPSPSRHRYIFQSHWRQEGGLFVYRITANAFLWHMVRRLVGAMVRLCSLPQGVEHFEKMLRVPTTKVPAPAPASGLYLYKVVYHVREFPH